MQEKRTDPYSTRCDKNGASGKRCDMEGQPERASVWENASQCEELTAILLLSEASEDFLMESPAVAAHPLRFPSSLFLNSRPRRGRIRIRFRRQR